MQSARPNPAIDDVKTSVTALSVAMAFSRSLATKYEYLFNRAQLDLAIHLWQTGRQSLGWFNWALSGALSKAPYNIQQSFFNTVVVPAYDAIIMLRKLMINNKIKSSIADGTTQIIFLGGGYDIRALITAIDNPNVKVYELDRGPTRESKLKGLMSIPKGIGFDDMKISTDKDGTLILGNNLRYIKCDLGKDNLDEVLSKHGFKSNEKSLFIAEGLTMYLSKSENQNLLNVISHLLSQNSECLLSYVSAIKNVGSLEKNALDEAKETYQFPLPPRDVIPFTTSLGFDVRQKFDATTRLRELGEASAIYYQNNPNLPKELYYLLQKAEIIPNKSIDEVPNIDFDIPNHHPAPSASSICTIV